jgi:peptide/nickel transport system ATP-binding protein
MAMLFISHDLGTVARIADRVVVLRAGIVEESGETAIVLSAPVAAYTRKLLAATPDPLAPQPARQAVGATLLSVENMRVQHGARGWFGRGERVDAVDDVSFTLA